MFRTKLDNPSSSTMLLGMLGAIMIAFGPCLPCRCLGDERPVFVPAKSSDAAHNDSPPCECRSVSPRAATHSQSRTDQRQTQPICGPVCVLRVALERPAIQDVLTISRPILPPPGLDELQVFLE